MNSVLANAVLAFLESKRGGNLIDLKRFLIERNFREDFLKSVADEEIRYYWQNEFPQIKGKPFAPLLTRLDTFLRSKLIRHIVAQKENRLDFRRIMDERKILLVRLSPGAIGQENAYLLKIFAFTICGIPPRLEWLMPEPTLLRWQKSSGIRILE